MWVFRGLVFLVLLFALVYFFISNYDQTVDINFFGKSFMAISIYWVVVLSFLLGFASSFLLAAIREFRFHREISGLKRAQATKDREIADLRTLPLRPGHSAEADSSHAGEDSGE